MNLMFFIQGAIAHAWLAAAFAISRLRGAIRGARR